MKNTEFNKSWETVTKEKSIWEYMYIKDHSLYFEKDDNTIKLTSYKTKDLPKRTSKLTIAGNILVNLSTLGNIMSRCPGTEEVTLYSLLSTPQSGFFGTSFDAKLLRIVAPPITWRRVAVESTIRYTLKKYISDYKEPFVFMDIGSGCGFDGLEINRIADRMQYLCKEQYVPTDNEIINIDISSKWLHNNEVLCDLLCKKNSNTKRYNISIFDYLEQKLYEQDCKGKKNLIVSCNGFAEFLDDETLTKLYMGIRKIAGIFTGRVHIILPFSIKDDYQQKIADKIGFGYRAKPRLLMENLIGNIFPQYYQSFEEKYSQIVMTLERKSDF